MPDFTDKEVKIINTITKFILSNRGEFPFMTANETSIDVQKFVWENRDIFK